MTHTKAGKSSFDLEGSASSQGSARREGGRCGLVIDRR